eukprot:gene17520-26953_t
MSVTRKDALGIIQHQYPVSFNGIPEVVDEAGFASEVETLGERLQDIKGPWSDRLDALKKLQSLILGGAPRLPNYYELVHEKLRFGIVAQVSDLRSAIVKEACLLLMMMCKMTAPHTWEDIVTWFVPALQKQLPVTVQIIADVVNQTLRFFIENNRMSPAGFKCLVDGTKFKNAKTRIRSYEHLFTFIHHAPIDHLNHSQQDLLFSAIVQGISDTDSIVRQLARLTYCGLEALSERSAAEVLRRLNPGQKKQVAAERQNYTRIDSTVLLPRHAHYDNNSGAQAQGNGVAAPASTTRPSVSPSSSRKRSGTATGLTPKGGRTKASKLSPDKHYDPHAAGNYAEPVHQQQQQQQQPPPRAVGIPLQEHSVTEINILHNTYPAAQQDKSVPAKKSGGWAPQVPPKKMTAPPPPPPAAQPPAANGHGNLPPSMHNAPADPHAHGVRPPASSRRLSMHSSASNASSRHSSQQSASSKRPVGDEDVEMVPVNPQSFQKPARSQAHLRLHSAAEPIVMMSDLAAVEELLDGATVHNNVDIRLDAYRKIGEYLATTTQPDMESGPMALKVLGVLSQRLTDQTEGNYKVVQEMLTCLQRSVEKYPKEVTAVIDQLLAAVFNTMSEKKGTVKDKARSVVDVIMAANTVGTMLGGLLKVLDSPKSRVRAACLECLVYILRFCADFLLSSKNMKQTMAKLL